MMIGEEHRIMGNWFIIHFTENNGMAFGMELGGNWGKLTLSLFRIIFVDDEAIIRNGISQCIPWSDIGFELTGLFEPTDIQDEVLLKNGFKLNYTLSDVDEFNHNKVKLIDRSPRRPFSNSTKQLSRDLQRIVKGSV